MSYVTTFFGGMLCGIGLMVIFSLLAASNKPVTPRGPYDGD